MAYSVVSVAEELQKPVIIMLYPADSFQKNCCGVAGFAATVRELVDKVKVPIEMCIRDRVETPASLFFVVRGGRGPGADNASLFFSGGRLLVQLHQFRHAGAFRHGLNVEVVGPHYGPVVLLVGAAKLRRHSKLVVEIRQRGCRI